MRIRVLFKRSLFVAATGLAVTTAAIVILLIAMLAENHLPVQFPEPSGRFAVGRTHFDWLEQRAEPFAPRPGIRRQLVVWIWYPAQAHTGVPAKYLPRPWQTALAHRGGILMTDFLTRDLSAIQIHTLKNASLASDPSRFPIVLLLAGSGALVTSYTALAEDLASHGYIVIGPEAAYRTSVVVLSNDTVLYRSPQDDLDNLPEDQAVSLAIRLVTTWSTDLGFIIDQLARLNTDPASQFASRLDLKRLGVVGHSLGGAIAAEFCRTDSRCRAGVDLDGRLFGPVITQGLHKPFMFMFEAALSQANPGSVHILAQAHSMYARLPASSRLGLFVSGANHFSFSDQMLIKNPILLRLMRFVGAIGGLGGRRGLLITEEYVRTFLDVHLKGMPESNLRALKYPEVRIWTN